MKNERKKALSRKILLQHLRSSKLVGEKYNVEEIKKHIDPYLKRQFSPYLNQMIESVVKIVARESDLRFNDLVTKFGSTPISIPILINGKTEKTIAGITLGEGVNPAMVLKKILKAIDREKRK